MRISDWSSDVCSSDLAGDALPSLCRRLPVRQMRQASSRHRYSSFPPCCSPVPVVLCGSYAEQGSGGRHRPAIRQEIRRRRLKLSDNPTAPLSPCSSDVANLQSEERRVGKECVSKF